MLVFEFPTRQNAYDFADYYTEAPISRHHRVVEATVDRSRYLEARQGVRADVQGARGACRCVRGSASVSIRTGMRVRPGSGQGSRAPATSSTTSTTSSARSGREGFDAFIKLNEFDPGEAKQLRDLAPGATFLGGGGAAPDGPSRACARASTSKPYATVFVPTATTAPRSWRDARRSGNAPHLRRAQGAPRRARSPPEAPGTASHERKGESDPITSTMLRRASR